MAWHYTQTAQYAREMVAYCKDAGLRSEAKFYKKLAKEREAEEAKQGSQVFVAPVGTPAPRPTSSKSWDGWSKLNDTKQF